MLFKSIFYFYKFYINREEVIKMIFLNKKIYHNQLANLNISKNIKKKIYTLILWNTRNMHVTLSLNYYIAL